MVINVNQIKNLWKRLNTEHGKRKQLEKDFFPALDRIIQDKIIYMFNATQHQNHRLSGIEAEIYFNKTGVINTHAEPKSTEENQS